MSFLHLGKLFNGRKLLTGLCDPFFSVYHISSLLFLVFCIKTCFRPIYEIADECTKKLHYPNCSLICSLVILLYFQMIQFTHIYAYDAKSDWSNF